MKIRTNLEGWGHTYERTNELGGGHVHTNDKLGGGDVHTNEQTNERTWMGGLTHERTNIFFLTPDSSFICIDVWALSLHLGL